MGKECLYIDLGNGDIIDEGDIAMRKCHGGFSYKKVSDLTYKDISKIAQYIHTTMEIKQDQKESLRRSMNMNVWRYND